MSLSLQQIYNDLTNPAVDMGAALMGAGAFVREITAFLLKALTILKTPKAQAEIKDVRTLAADFQQAAVDAGHPEPAQVNQAVNALLASLPVVQIQPVQPPVIGVAPVVKGLLIALALAGLAGHAHAASLSLGPISISPTASAPVVIVQPFLVAETWAVAGGGELGLRNDKIGGFQAGPAWGPYGCGLAVGIDEDTVAGVTYLTGGGYAEFMPWGEALILARNGGATLSLTIPWELGGSVTN